MRAFHYETCCVESDGPSITAMVDRAREITYRTFRRHCAGVDAWAKAHGYGLRPPELTLKQDWHVAYYKSVYRSRPCYFLVWSAIEFIWTEAEAKEAA